MMNAVIENQGNDFLAILNSELNSSDIKYSINDEIVHWEREDNNSNRPSSHQGVEADNVVNLFKEDVFDEYNRYLQAKPINYSPKTMGLH